MWLAANLLCLQLDFAANYTIICFFIGAENKGGEENSKENLENFSEIDPLEQIEPGDNGYKEEPEDNTEEKEFFEEEMEQIRKRMKEIDQNRE